MKQLIDKYAVVAGIENRIKELQNLYEENKEKLDSIQKTAIFLCIDECKGILSFLNTLEIKEVDVEKELERLDSLLYDLDGIAIAGTTSYLTVEDVKDIAKRFFEMGLKAQEITKRAKHDNN